MHGMQTLDVKSIPKLLFFVFVFCLFVPKGVVLAGGYFTTTSKMFGVQMVRPIGDTSLAKGVAGSVFVKKDSMQRFQCRLFINVCRNIDFVS